MRTYAKTAKGETLTYRPSNLNSYDGEQFCLRITLDDQELERCFFVYIDERFEGYSLRKLLQTYLIQPDPEHSEELAGWLGPWMSVDSTLLKKCTLLQQMFGRVRDGSSSVTYHINHGPSHLNLDDPVRSHLGSSVFEDGSFNDKILDVVLDFRVEGGVPPEVEQWTLFPLVDTSTLTEIPHSARIRRRGLFGIFGILVALLFIGCGGTNRDDENRDGFQGGAL